MKFTNKRLKVILFNTILLIEKPLGTFDFKAKKAMKEEIGITEKEYNEIIYGGGVVKEKEKTNERFISSNINDNGKS